MMLIKLALVTFTSMQMWDNVIQKDHFQSVCPLISTFTWHKNVYFCIKLSLVHLNIINLIPVVLWNYSTLKTSVFVNYSPHMVNISDKGNQIFALSQRFKSFWFKKKVGVLLRCWFYFAFKNVILKDPNVLQILKLVKTI